MSERGVAAIQLIGRAGHDEELHVGLIDVRLLSSHADDAGNVLDVGALELNVATARAGSLWVAALNHEVLDDAMELEAVILAGVDRRHEPLDGLGRPSGVQLECHRALGRLHTDNPVLFFHVTLLVGDFGRPDDGDFRERDRHLIGHAGIGNRPDRNAGDLVHNIHPFNNMAKRCERTVQTGVVAVHYKELHSDCVTPACDDAMEMTPWTWLTSVFSKGIVPPPVPLPFGSPPWIMNPFMTRWKVSPSYLPPTTFSTNLVTVLGALSPSSSSLIVPMLVSSTTYLLPTTCGA